MQKSHNVGVTLCSSPYRHTHIKCIQMRTFLKVDNHDCHVTQQGQQNKPEVHSQCLTLLNGNLSYAGNPLQSKPSQSEAVSMWTLCEWMSMRTFLGIFSRKPFLNRNPCQRKSFSMETQLPIGHLLTWNLYLAELFSVGIFLNGLTFGNLEIPQSAVC